MVQAGSPAVSPDGATVAFTVSRTDLAKNKVLSQIWLAAADGSTPPRPLTGGDHDSKPAWSPDGHSLAFVSARSAKKGETTLHVIPVGTHGETRTIATMKEAIGDVAFSPDGRWIAYTCRTPDARYEAEDESWQAPRKIDRFFSQLDDEGWVIDRPRHAYLVAADGTGKPRNLTPGECKHNSISWRADSTAVVVSSQRHETWDTDFAWALYEVLLDGQIVALTAMNGSYGSPSVSPDGTQLAFLGNDDSQTSPQNVHVGLVAAAGGEHRWISCGIDRTFGGSGAPVWLDDSTMIATLEDRGEAHLYRLTTDGAAPEPMTSGALTVDGFDAAGGVIAFAADAVDAVSDIFVLDDGAPRRLTSFADTYRAAAQPLSWERFAVPTADGSAEIDAWIMRPAGFDAADTYPVLLNVHGGPHAQYGETLFDEAQMQAAAGFVVVVSNPRGSSGREQSWGQSIMGPLHAKAPGSGWGTLDVDDVLSVLDAALQRYSFCDSRRVGMLGGSYGGFMATWLAGRQGGRFKAICSERAVNNMLTEEFTSDIATTFRIEIGLSFVDAPEEYRRLSPINFVGDINVPMLLIHSENDLRCPINQAEELFVMMRLLGKDVTFYRFPGEGHELSRSGSPVHRRQRAEIILDFFAEHLAPA